jgi:enamine deaminase RidA (YjgF/YER057c/UK114 family)
MSCNDEMTASDSSAAGAEPERRFISSGSPWEAMAGYSRAVVDGSWIFVSGTVGIDNATARFPESAEAQTELALDIVEAALRQVPASLMDIVRVRVYVPDRDDVAAVSQVMKRRLGSARATNTTVCCALAVPEAKVEIEVTARLPITARHGAD